MNNLLFLILLMACPTQALCQNNIPIINEVKTKSNPLDTLHFDQIVAYNINFDSLNRRRTYVQMGNDALYYDLSPKHTSSKRLVESSIYNDIIQLFSDSTSYGEEYADCFEPRFVLQFNHNNHERFRIIICEGCGFLISTIPIPSAYIKYIDHQLETEGKKEIYRRYKKGFSTAGAKKINDLCKMLEMGYCRGY
jgi:hypothetical protein